MKIKSSMRDYLKRFVIKVYEKQNAEKQIIFEMFNGFDEEQIIWYLIILTEIIVKIQKI